MRDEQTHHCHSVSAVNNYRGLFPTRPSAGGSTAFGVQSRGQLSAIKTGSDGRVELEAAATQ